MKATINITTEAGRSNSSRTLVELGAKWPQPVRFVVGVVIAALVVVISPLLALIRPDWAYIARKVWDEIVCSWAYGVKEIVVAAVKHNGWFVRSQGLTFIK